MLQIETALMRAGKNRSDNFRMPLCLAIVPLLRCVKQNSTSSNARGQITARARRIFAFSSNSRSEKRNERGRRSLTESATFPAEHEQGEQFRPTKYWFRYQAKPQL